ncbi:zinc finger and BTB domain-containing protein 39-like [Lampetra fluviatilis]
MTSRTGNGGRCRRQAVTSRDGGGGSKGKSGRLAERSSEAARQAAVAAFASEVLIALRLSLSAHSSPQPSRRRLINTKRSASLCHPLCSSRLDRGESTMAEAVEDGFRLKNVQMMPELLGELCELRQTGSFCDVVVEVQSRRYLAHKAVLSSTCRYFRTVLFNAPCSSLGPFVLDFVGVVAFEKVLDFLYRGDVLVGRGDVRELYSAAQNLGLESLELIIQPILETLDDVDEIANGTSTSFDDDVQQERYTADVRELVQLKKRTESANFKDRKARMSCDVKTERVNNTQCLQERYAGHESAIEGCGNEKDLFPTLGPRFLSGSDDSQGRCRRNSEQQSIIGFHNGSSGDQVRTDGIPRGSTEDENGQLPLPMIEVKQELDDDSNMCSYDTADIVGSQGMHAKEDKIEILQNEQDYNVIGVEGKYMPTALMTASGLKNETPEEGSVVDSPKAYGYVQCQICGETLEENMSSLREHATMHVDRETLECRVCRRKFSLFNRAVEHILSHAGITVLSCNDCGKKLLSPARLSLHYKNCKMRKSYAGRQNAWQRQQPSQPQQTSDGIADTSDDGYGSMPCQVCGMAVPKKMAVVRRHARLHVDMEKLVCKVCGLQTTSSGNLVKHTLLHIGVFIHECSVCGKGFPFQSLLQQHQRRMCMVQEAVSTPDAPGPESGSFAGNPQVAEAVHFYLQSGSFQSSAPVEGENSFQT